MNSVQAIRHLTLALVILGCLSFSGCDFVHDEHITGPYRLIAVDVDSQMSISYGLESGDAIGRIE